MSEMIERVARAIYAINPEMRGEVYRDSELIDPGEPMSWEEWAAEPHNGLADVIRAEARAAIEAMREPTPAMTLAGATDNTPRVATNSLDRMFETVGLIFSAMIDAALSPTPTGDPE